MDNLEPNPKNPIIASFFRNIGYADQLGSGVRNLFKYTEFYSGQKPEFKEGDIFRIVVPLDDAYSFDFGLMKTENGISDTNNLVNETENAGKVPISADKVPISADKIPIIDLSAQQKIIFQFVDEKGQITSHQAEMLLEVKQRRARIILGEMIDLGVLERKGSYRSTVYVLKERREKV